MAVQRLAPGGQYAAQARWMVDGLNAFATGARHADAKPWRKNSGPFLAVPAVIKRGSAA